MTGVDELILPTYRILLNWQLLFSRENLKREQSDNGTSITGWSVCCGQWGNIHITAL